MTDTGSNCFASSVELFSFFVVRVSLQLPKNLPGSVLLHRAVSSTGWKGPPHRHTELEMNLVVRGDATLVIRNRRYELLPRTAVWLFPDEDHMVFRQSADFEMWVLVFRQRVLRAVQGGEVEQLLLRKSLEGEPCRLLSGQEARRLTSDCVQISAAGRGDPILRVGLEWLALRGWRAFLSAESAPIREELHPSVVKAARLLQERPEWESLSELGPTCGLSSGRLSRLFHEQIGSPLAQFRTRERLRKFHEIRDRYDSLTTAALEAGFQSYVQFYRAYREATGEKPSAEGSIG